MKQDNFVKGAMISTICIVFSKILGIIYVIPFHMIIGKNGQSLYGYAYNMYLLFLNFSTVGIPLAVSKMISEYNETNYNDAKRKTYKMAIIITLSTAVVSTILLFALAPTISNMILGNMTGGNSKEDIIFVLRVISSALIFVTLLSCMRGYLQGHKYITVSSISQIVEQFVRIFIIIAGSYIAMKLWGTKEAVGIAVFAATISSIAAIIYLGIHIKKSKVMEYKENKKEKFISNKEIVIKLIKYTIPFVLVSIAVSIYNTIDMFTIVKALVKFGNLSVSDSEMILSVISTWGAKLNSIITSIAAGVIVAVLPNISGDYVKNDEKEISKKVNQTLQMLCYFIIPMVLGLSFLANPVWNLFYGKNELCINVFKYSIFTSIFNSIFINLHTIMQSVNRHKKANIAIFVGILIKLLLNYPMIILFSKISFIPTYYGSITVTILAYLIPIIIYINDLKNSRNIEFTEAKKSILKSLFAALIMILVLYIIKLLLPLEGKTIYSLIVVGIYSIIGAIIYLFITSKTKLVKEVFDTNILGVIKKKIKK